MAAAAAAKRRKRRRVRSMRFLCRLACSAIEHAFCRVYKIVTRFRGGATMGMKIWYQSMSRQTVWSSYSNYLKQIIDQVKDPDTEVEVHGIAKIGGVAPQYRYLEFLETGEVMENVHQAIERKFDAFLIGNIIDPGLRECREIANFPVLGLCETTCHVACMSGASFSLVTINEKFTPRVI